MVLTQTIVIVLTVIGTTIFYMTSKQQRIINRHLSMKYIVLAAGILLLALYGWLQILSTAAAIFTWFFSSAILLICLPFLTLIVKKEKQSWHV